MGLAQFPKDLGDDPAVLRYAAALIQRQVGVMKQYEQQDWIDGEIDEHRAIARCLRHMAKTLPSPAKRLRRSIKTPRCLRCKAGSEWIET